MNTYYLISVIFSLLIIKINGFVNFKLLEDSKAVIVTPGSYLNIKYNNPTTTPGLMYVLAFRSLHDVNMPWDLGNRTIIPNEGEDNFFVPNDTQKGEEIFYSVIVKYDDGEMVSKVTQTYYSEAKMDGASVFTDNVKDNLKFRHTQLLTPERRKEDSPVEKVKKFLIFLIPAIMILAIGFLVYQKVFKPKAKINSKKSDIKFNYEKNPALLKTLEDQEKENKLHSRSSVSSVRSKSSLTNLKNFQSKASSPVSPSMNYESSNLLNRRSACSATSDSSDLSFKLDGSYLDVKLKDEDESEEEENDNKVDSEDENTDEEDTEKENDTTLKGKEETDITAPENDKKSVKSFKSAKSSRHSPRSKSNSKEKRSPSNYDYNHTREVKSASSQNSLSSSDISDTVSGKTSTSIPLGNNNQNYINISNFKKSNLSNTSLKTDTQRLTHYSLISNTTTNSAGNNSYFSEDLRRINRQNYPNSYLTTSTNNEQAEFATKSGSEDTAEIVSDHPFTQKVFSVAYINIPENDDELELAIGDQIKFLEIYDDDWALASRLSDNKEGMVPLTCVKEYFTMLNRN
ncbi:hypothetical protein H8356DRAFT_1673571 [Neocallimastix lanati (nom. inval.)]|jgi:hypothetical protein|nr:hypothetical protein H8356DRAFT_1673571 [Neocallimastix sp. JGI-2020a]